MWKIVSFIVISVCVKSMIYAENCTETQTEVPTEVMPEHGEYGLKCNCRCGERNEDSRIVGGVETTANAYPWVVRMSYHKKFYCGGTIINDRFVLTAGHCVKGFLWFMIKVTFGEHNRCNNTHRPVTRYVIQAISNNFSYTNFNNDIALLRLHSPIKVTDTVKPVCLPKNDDKSYAGETAVATGWGAVEEGKKPSCYLREVELPILTNVDCKKSNYTPSMISDTMLCAGYISEGKKDACQGDSGGGLTAERSDKRHEQIGVVSWGIGCGRAGYPGVYTRVTKYLDWIKANAKAGCYCTE